MPANGTPPDQAKLTRLHAVNHAVALILGPLPETQEFEAFGEYAGILEDLGGIYTEAHTHEAVQAAYVGMREELQVKAPMFFRMLERRLRQRRGQPADAKAIPVLKTVTGTQLLEMNFADPVQAIPGLVGEGTNILGGRPKEGKSFMALDWCLAVAAGGRALGKIRVEAGEALYIGLEDSYRRIKKRVEGRLRAAKANTPANTDRFHCLTDFPALDEGGVEALATWLDAHPDCRLVVIDVLQAIAPRQNRRNGNQYADDYAMLKDLHRLAVERHLPILLVCHTTKARHENVVDEINATTGLAGKVDTIIVLSQAAPGRWVLKATGRDIERQELAIRFDPQTGAWVSLGEAKEHATTDERKAILKAVKAAGKPLSPRDIARRLGKTSNRERATVRQLLNKMRRAQQVAVTPKGRYVPYPHTHTSHSDHTDHSNHTNHTNHRGEESVLPADPVTAHDSPSITGQVMSGQEKTPAVTAVTDIPDNQDTAHASQVHAYTQPPNGTNGRYQKTKQEPWVYPGPGRHKHVHNGKNGETSS